MVSIFSIILSVVAILFLSGLIMRKAHFVEREIIVNQSLPHVFNYIKFLKNQDEFNIHTMASSDRIRNFKGEDGFVGFVYAWSGDKGAGVGEKEILEIVDGEKIVFEIRFKKPMVTKARIVMKTECIAENQTKVIWSNSGELIYPINILIPLMEKSVGKGMQKSLLNLKRILEEKEF